MIQLSCTIYECWRDWRDYMNEDSGVMIVRTRCVCISELLLCCTPGTAIEYSHI